MTNRFQAWLDEHAHDRSPEILEKVRKRGEQPFKPNLFSNKNGYAPDDAYKRMD